MIYVSALIVSAVILTLVWLVATEKIKFPLLFELGLTVIALGLIPWFDGAMHKGNTLNAGAAAILTGIVILFASLLREKKKQKKRARTGPPREIDGRHIHHITGGKQQ